MSFSVDDALTRPIQKFEMPQACVVRGDGKKADPQQQQQSSTRSSSRSRSIISNSSNGPREDEEEPSTTKDASSDIEILTGSFSPPEELSPSVYNGSKGFQEKHGDDSDASSGSSSSPSSHDGVHSSRGQAQQQRQPEVVSARSDVRENASPGVLKIRRAWDRARVVAERALHLRREIKAIFSSELERCLLKATRPENTAVDEACVQALLVQANRLAAVQARFDCDPHEVVCSKLFKKMMEKDWRTVAKALYVVHRLQRDSPPKDAARFSTFFKEKWADGVGELGRHMRAEGGENAPWLKVYSGYLAARGRGLETAQNAFCSWETLTSARQLRNGLAEANALLTKALALHFADDASSTRLGGGSVRRACCALAFQDVADIRAMVCGTGRPPALIGVPGLGDIGPERKESSNGRPMVENSSAAIDVVVNLGDRYNLGDPPGWKDDEVDSGNATMADGSAQESSAGVGGANWGENKKIASARSSSPSEILGATDAAGADTEEVTTASVWEESTIAVAAKEGAMYEEVSGVIAAVYSARYGAEASENTPAIPLWVQQLATLARRNGADGPHHL